MSDIKEYPYNLSYSERLEEIIRLREALEFYADKGHYPKVSVIEDQSAIKHDKGKRAREALTPEEDEEGFERGK